MIDSGPSTESDSVSSREPCPICMEVIQIDRNTATTCCGHKFCFACVATMLFRNMPLCPCCRTSMIPTAPPREPRVLPPSITGARPENSGRALFLPPPPPGEYVVFSRGQYEVQHIRAHFMDNTAPIHPTIWSSAWPAEHRPDNIDVRNFTKLFRIFDFPNCFRSTMSTLHAEFNVWRRFEEVRRPSTRRTTISKIRFETMLNDLGIVRSSVRGKTIWLGHCRGGYNLFIEGSFLNSEAITFPHRVLVDPPDVSL
jgi:Zinc finger, C3HC4 type (RING finger)